MKYLGVLNFLQIFLYKDSQEYSYTTAMIIKKTVNVQIQDTLVF